MRFEDIDPDWSWMSGKHRGLAEWLPRVCEHFAVSKSILADHFAFVEAFKHATPDQPALTRHARWKQIRADCPKWLVEQLVRLRPRLLILCGSAGKDIIAPLLFDERTAGGMRRTRVREIHGRTAFVQLDDLRIPVVFTFAISGQTVARWRAHPATTTVRTAVLRALS